MPVQYPYGTDVAVDPSGNLFITEGGNEVMEVTPSGVQIPFDLVGDWDGPSALATDSAGNLFVVNAGGELDELTPAGLETTIVSNVDDPQGVAVDSAGNIYVANTGADQVLKVCPSGTETLIGSGFTEPVSIAVDSVGNVYVGNMSGPNRNQAFRITPQGVQTAIASGFTYTGGVAVDSFGDVCGADFEGNVVDRISAAPRAANVAVGSVAVSWQPPTYNGTSLITSYKVTAVDAHECDPRRANLYLHCEKSRKRHVHGHKADQRGQLHLLPHATNKFGAGPSSAQTNSVKIELPPTVTSISPSSGPKIGGTVITITGTGFALGAKAVIGSGTGAVVCTSVGVASSTKLIATTGAAPSSGKLNVYVTANGATSAASTGGVFTYVPT